MLCSIKRGEIKLIKYLKCFSITVLLILLMIPHTMISAADNAIIPDDDITTKDSGKNVLVLNSYAYDWESVPKQIDGIKSILADEAILDYIFMDTKHLDSKVSEKQTYQLINTKIDNGSKYDLILACDDAALDFVLKYKEELFKDIPIVFEGINTEKKAYSAASDGNMTGIVESFPMEETIELAMKLYPQATKVVAISDKTVSGQGSLEQFYDAKEYIPQLEFEDINMSEMNKEEISNIISSYGTDTILLYLMFTQDKTGAIYTTTQAVELITNSARIPVFKADEVGIGCGLLGGDAVSYYDMGADAAKMAKSILSGNDIKNIPIQIVKAKYSIDYDVMNKYNLKEKDFPETTDFINKDITFFEENKTFVISIIIIFSILLLVVAYVSYDNNKRGRLIKEIRDKDELLNSLMDRIPGGIGIFTVESGETAIEYLNDGYYSLLNIDRISREAIYGKSLLNTIMEEDRNGLLIKIQEVVEGIKTIVDYDMRIIVDNNKYKWINLKARIVESEGEKTVFYASFNDVDDMVLAHEQIKESEAELKVAINHSGMKFWQYFPSTHTSIQGYKVRYEFGVPEVMENFPDSWIALGITHPDDIGAMIKMHERIDNGERTATCEIRLKYGDNYSWERLRYTTIINTKGKIIKAIGTSENLDAYKDLEERFMISTIQSGFFAWIYDIKEKTIIQDKNTRDIYGYGHIIRNVPDCFKTMEAIHDDDIHLVNEMYQRISDGEKTVSCTARWKRPYSEEYWWSKIIYTVINDKEGKPIKAFGTSIDVTEQKKLEKRFEEELVRRQVLEENVIASGCYNVTQNIIIEYYAKEIIVGKSLLSMTMEESALEIIKQTPSVIDKGNIVSLCSQESFAQKFIDGETQFGIEYRRNMSDGTLKWVSTMINLVKNPETNDIMGFVYTYDVDEEKKEQMTLESIVDEEVDFVSYLDLNDNSNHLIKIGASITLLPPKEACDFDKMNEEYIPQYVYKEDRKLCYEEFYSKNIVDNLKNDRIHAVIFRSVEPDGTIRRKKISYYYLDDGKDIVVFVRRDITDIYEEEQRQSLRLEKALNESKEASRAKSEFLSRMSHEIRTPMNAIIGLTSLTKEKADDSEYVKNNLEKVDMSAHFLLSLINDILDISRIESGKMVLNPSRINFSKFIKEINSIIKNSAESKGVNFTCDVDDKIDRYYTADELKIKQVLINVLLNAVKFTPQDGSVSFVINLVSNEDNNTIIRFTITDTGIGINKEFLPKIFDAFEQEYSDNTTLYVGTGLGLAISKNIIDMMQGDISVHSKKGEGTTFIVDIPFIRCQNSNMSDNCDEVTATNGRKDYGLSGKRILLVEDNEINREIAKCILERVNIEVNCATNGVEAIEIFGASDINYYQAILMDVRMPIMDGLTATEHIRALDRDDSKRIPIIAMTANAFEEDARKSIESGMNVHLTKPIEPTILYSKLSEMLNN